MSETFQSVVYGRVEAEHEAINDLLSEVGHQLQGADAGHGKNRHADGDDGYVEQAASVLHDDAAAVQEMFGKASSAVQDVEASAHGVLEDDLSALKGILGDIQGDGPSPVVTFTPPESDHATVEDIFGGMGADKRTHGADPHNVSPARGRGAAAPRRPNTGNRYAESDAEAFYSTSSDPQFVAPSESNAAEAFYSTSSDPQFVAPSADGFLPYPGTSPGLSPVPVVSAGPTPGSAGITLGDVLSLVGEGAQATTAVANAVTTVAGANRYRPAYGPPAAVGVYGVPGAGVPAWGEVESIHRHRVGRFAHERPVIFLIGFAAVLYFLFLSEDSIWEKVLHTGTKSKKHDKVETFTEEIHTKRESVLGKPTFPSQAAPSPAPSESSSSAPMP